MVADDHPLYRDVVIQHVHRLFAHAQIDEASSLDELCDLAMLPRSSFELFLLDFHMPGMSVEAIAALADRFPATPIAVISGTAQNDDIRAIMNAGARGFIPKTATSDYLVSTLKLLLAGGSSMPADLLTKEAATTYVNTSTLTESWQSMLTPRERDVLRGVVRGLSNKEIGRELDLAEVTVKLHLRGVFRKMQARSRANAAVTALRAGFA